MNGLALAQTEILNAAGVVAVGQGLHQLRQGPFAFAANDVIGMVETFPGQKAGMGPSQHHRLALLAVKIRQLIGPGGGRGNTGNTDQVRLELQSSVVRGGQLFDDHLDLQALVSQDGAQQQRPQARNGHPAEDMFPGGPGFDEKNLINGVSHAPAPREG